MEAGPEGEPEPGVEWGWGQGRRGRTGDTRGKPASVELASSEGKEASCRGGTVLRLWAPETVPGDLGRHGGQYGTWEV